ncbi:MAG TPA: isoprenylcysteine carboxylmethyltransferase family protein [Allosphingosinicella sp.]|nr:isoprenylcysteine carboxylmethyltransferase family protein [Allosphingosinicella sp.]
MTRWLAAAYGAVVYLIFFVTFLYAIGFVGDLIVPKGIDSGTPGPLAAAVLIDVALLGLFAVQHSLMARPFFKRWWTRFVPAIVERSTYVLLSSIVLILLFWLWRPLPETIWLVAAPNAALLLQAIFWLGWATVLLSTFLISHFELFGLQQVWLGLKQRVAEPPRMRTPFLYGFVRHPLYFGFLLAFWATPHMTMGHLLFAAATTAYILIAVRLEEHDLIAIFGADYVAYRRRVSMLIPLPPRGAAKDAETPPAATT